MGIEWGEGRKKFGWKGVRAGRSEGRKEQGLNGVMAGTSSDVRGGNVEE